MSLSNNFPTIRPSLFLDFASAGRLDPRITFVRNTTARYYDGVTTAVAEQNFQTYSQELNNATGWASNFITVTANTTTAPDGTSTADLVAETADTNVHWIFSNNGVFTSLAATYTFSVFLKKGPGATAPDIVQLTFRVAGASGAQYANFNISAGTVTASADLISSSITAAGGGWYRCSITRTLTAAANAGGAIAFTNNNPTATRGTSYLGATTSDVLVWGAQLEQRSTATAYTATTNLAITNYVPVLLTAPVNTARFDYNPVTGAALGLMVEETRTNLLTYSADFANASWSKVDIALTSNTIVAPDGTLSGTKYIPNSLTTAKFLNKNHSITAGTALTFSLYIKAGEYNNCVLYFDGLSTGRYGALFDLSNQTATVGSLNTAGTAAGFQSITAVGNGWFRCVIGFTDTTLNDGAISTTVRYTAGAAGYNSVTGNDFSGFFIWGAQLEAGTSVSSYIPTVASTVPRNQDEASLTGTNFSSWYNASEFTVVTEATLLLGVGMFPRIYTINNGANNNETVRQSANGDALTESNFVTYAGVQQVNFFNAISRNTEYTKAFAARVNDFAYCRSDLTSTQTSASGNMALGLNRMTIGWDSVNGFSSMAYIKKLTFYPARLTNTQVFNLTR